MHLYSALALAAEGKGWGRGWHEEKPVCVAPTLDVAYARASRERCNKSELGIGIVRVGQEGNVSNSK